MKNLQAKLHGLWVRRHLTLLALAAFLLTAAASTDRAYALYILTGTDDAAIVLNDAAKAPDLSDKMIFVTTGGKGYDVTLSAGQSVTVRRDGTIQTVESQQESVSALLRRLDITPSPLETVAVNLAGPGVDITVAEEITYYDRVTETAHFETVRVANPNMLKGTEKVVQQGVDGVRTAIYEVVFSNGQELSRQFVEVLDSTAVDQIVEYGTAADASVNIRAGISSVSKNSDGSGVLTLTDGSTLKFTSTKTMRATAYTAGHDGVGSRTATGTTVRVGTVAVDKKVIPLGTKMYIVTNDGIVYGTAVAEDTGIRGDKLDLYHETYQQCINFGRRTCTVYILE